MNQTLTSVLSNAFGKQKAQVGFILGSGLGELVTAMKHTKSLPYSDIPGLKSCSVQGHSGQLIVGQLENTQVACFQGRFHGYEGTDPEQYITMMDALLHLDCQYLVITNAAGGINPQYAVGDVVMIKDHINFQGQNLLVGKQPPAFIGMSDAYDAKLRGIMQQTAQDCAMNLQQGTYIGVMGPSFETPAEIKAFSTLGADLVGMSTVQEVIAARYRHLRVAAFSVVSNMAAGIDPGELSHQKTLEGAKLGCDQLLKLLKKVCQDRIGLQ
jgi:inosine/guanosine/xanthosine phosphorylase family protein